MQASCNNCVFWFKTDNGATICRRFPPFAEAPKVKFSPDGSQIEKYIALSFFPPMQADGWCGEHKGADS